MSREIDVSILIVHTYEKELLRQTLKGIRRAAPKVSYEVIVIDNNPVAGLSEVLKTEFPDTFYFVNKKNIGFGGAMNVGIKKARGRYILVFNPDIIVQPESLEEMVRFMDENSEVGMCGPKLLNPDRSLQYSCYRLPTYLLPVYRRTPIGKINRFKKIVEHYLMMHDDHSKTMDVDSLIGAALFCRREALDTAGLFDEQYFMYYEDNDLCRRFWENGYKVKYYPKAEMVHYHRRASADGGLFNQLFNRFTWIQISSFIKYIKKYRGKKNPRENFKQKHVGGI